MKQWEVIEVEFDLRVEEQLLRQLSDLVNAVNVHDLTWELTFSTTKDMRSALFDFQLHLSRYHPFTRSLYLWLILTLDHTFAYRT